MQSFAEWFSPYLLSDQEGLNTTELLNDFADLAGIELENLAPNELAIVDACLHAVLWGYPLEETYRYRQLDTQVQAKENELFKPAFAANWLNKQSSPAPDSSVVYVTSWLNLNSGDRILQTPENPDDNYYVWAILDSYINTVGSIGPRTQSEQEQNQTNYYLLAGPNSPYYQTSQATDLSHPSSARSRASNHTHSRGSASVREESHRGAAQNTLPHLDQRSKPHKASSNISDDWTTVISTAQGDQQVQIIRIDTPYAWITSRFATDTLSDAELSTTKKFINGSESAAESGFQLTSLADFKRTGSVPYQAPITESSSDTAAQKRWGSIPLTAQGFFQQLGEALHDSPVPSTIKPGSFSKIPSDAVWLGNQNNVQQQPGSNDALSANQYQPTSALSTAQKSGLNERFSTIGLNLDSGFSMPNDWSLKDREVFEASYQFTNKLLNKATSAIASGNKSTNNWHISNLDIGVYPNTWKHWLVRCGVAIDGGAANIPNDGVYPTTQLDQDGNTLRSTYNYTITLPALAESGGTTTYGPADGFWSFTIYQPNSGSAYQPFLIENAINNLAYTSLDAEATLTADGLLRTTKPGNWNSSTAEGTALRTGAEVSITGLKADTTYYVKNAVQDSNDPDKLLLRLSDSYEPDYNWAGIKGTRGVPLGGQGSAGEEVTLSAPRGTALSFGWIQPVSQLGSAQQDSLAVNGDGDIVLQLRAAEPETQVSNWLPTPNDGTVTAAYEFQVMARYYEPSTVDGQTILASEGDSTLYLPPTVMRTSMRRLNLWDQLDSAGTTLLLQRTGKSTIDPLNQQDEFDADAVGAVLDMRWQEGVLDGSSWNLTYDYSRHSDLKNKLFFYRVDDLTGRVGALKPGDAEYKNAALGRRINADQPISNDNDNSTQSGTLRLDGGSIYMPLVETESGSLLLPNARSTGGHTLFSLIGTDAFGFDDQPTLSLDDGDEGIFKVTGLTPVT